jgi:SAM-dependent methyltransferase
MRKPIREFVKICADNLPIKGPVFEFGALQVNEQEALEDLRPLFGGFDYVGCDMRGGPGVDRLLNLHKIDLPDNTVGCLVCMDTLEHVEYPRKALSEILRVLQPNGIAMISSVMNFPIHGYPNDYWRFTPEGFRSLLQEFDGSFIGSYGERDDFPQVIVGLGFKGDVPDMSAFLVAFKRWEHWYNTVVKNLAK